MKQKPGIILLIDFEKAFDTIKWSFIIKSLEHFQFGPDFIKWIKLIYNDIESTVINNGHTAGFFSNCKEASGKGAQSHHICLSWLLRLWQTVYEIIMIYMALL